MLDIKPFKQSEGMCGPASLRMILDHYGIEKTEEELAVLSGATREKGTYTENLAKAAEALGFKTELKDMSTFEDIQSWLDKGVPVIVNWFYEDEGHYSVVAGLDDKKIFLMDPDAGGPLEYDRDTFLRIWFGFKYEGDFMTSKDDIVIRRLLAVYK